MEKKETFDVFLSYSRLDERYVRPLREILELNNRRVFVDTSVLRPGDLWAKELEDALINSETFVILWCCDSAESEWVGREIDIAIGSNKSLVPVLLCDLPPPATLAAYQYIDWRESIRHSCKCHTQFVSSSSGTPLSRQDAEARVRRHRQLAIWIAIAYVLLLIFFAMSIFLPFAFPVVFPFLLLSFVIVHYGQRKAKKDNSVATIQALVFEALLGAKDK